MINILNSSVSNSLPAYAIGLIIAACLLALIPIIVLIAKKVSKHTKEKDVIEETIKLLAKQKELSLEEFLKFKDSTSWSNEQGVYVIYNVTKQMHIIGLNSNLVNKLDDRVYSDYKYGDIFKIKLVSLKDSGYSDLNTLLNDIVLTYKSFSREYGK